MSLEALTDVEAAIQDGIPADPAVAEPFSPELVEKVASVIVVYWDIAPLDVLSCAKTLAESPGQNLFAHGRRKRPFARNRARNCPSPAYLASSANAQVGGSIW